MPGAFTGNLPASLPKRTLIELLGSAQEAALKGNPLDDGGMKACYVLELVSDPEDFIAESELDRMRSSGDYHGPFATIWRLPQSEVRHELSSSNILWYRILVTVAIARRRDDTAPQAANSSFMHYLIGQGRQGRPWARELEGETAFLQYDDERAEPKELKEASSRLEFALMDYIQQMSGGEPASPAARTEEDDYDSLDKELLDRVEQIKEKRDELVLRVRDAQLKYGKGGAGGRKVSFKVFLDPLEGFLGWMAENDYSVSKIEKVFDDYLLTDKFSEKDDDLLFAEQHVNDYIHERLFQFFSIFYGKNDIPMDAPSADPALDEGIERRADAAHVSKRKKKETEENGVTARGAQKRAPAPDHSARALVWPEDAGLASDDTLSPEREQEIAALYGLGNDPKAHARLVVGQMNTIYDTLKGELCRLEESVKPENHPSLDYIHMDYPTLRRQVASRAAKALISFAQDYAEEVGLFYVEVCRYERNSWQHPFPQNDYSFCSALERDIGLMEKAFLDFGERKYESGRAGRAPSKANPGKDAKPRPEEVVSTLLTHFSNVADWVNSPGWNPAQKKTVEQKAE